VLIDKSRDMGASWLCLAVMVWFWQFVPDTPLLAASRKQQYVDERGNPDTLFWKLRYLIARQPDWLRPATEDRSLHIGNLDNGSTLDGESTNADLGRGGRRAAILLDEFAAVEPAEAAQILNATADATPCRIYNSTPQGRANAFADVRFSGKCKVITLHWTEHPDKGRGARQVAGEDGKLRWTSPWYEAERARRTSRKEIAQEIDIDYLASGEMFFDLDVLQRIRASGQIKPPTMAGDLAYTVRPGETTYRIENVAYRPDQGRRHCLLWSPLVGGRLRQDRNYVAFADISHGMGASNSVCKVSDANTREVVAMLVSPDLAPHDFARECVALCQWIGGTRPCILGWEANGPGGIFGEEVWRHGWGCVLGNPDWSGTTWHPRDGKIGWHSSPDEKNTVFGNLRGALARGEIVEHDEATIAELESYIYGPNRQVIPAHLVKEDGGAKAAHGDRVVALAGLLLCLAEQGMVKAKAPIAPDNSPAGRANRRADDERRRSEW